MKRYKNYLLLVCTILLALVLTACGEAVPDTTNNGSTETEGTDLDIDTSGSDTLVIGMTNAPHSQNPFNAQGASAVWAMRFFYESLLTQMSPTEFEPRLGELSTEDNQTFTVELNPDANWTDGEPVTAEDVAFTLNTIAHADTLTTFGVRIAMLEGTDESGKMAEGMEELPGVHVVDEKTLELTTKVPVDLNYISEFLGAGVLIAPKHVFEDIPKADLHTSDPAIQPTVFNGAYKFVEYQEENYLHMVANDDYYRGTPEIKDIYIRVLASAALVTELQSGGIHMVSSGGFGEVPHHDIELINNVEGLVVTENSSPNIQYMVVNNMNPRFEDPRVRQALAMAIDLELAVENLLMGHGEIPGTFFSSANTYKADDINAYPYDPDEARALLEEANFDFSQPVQLAVPTGNAIREQMGDLIEQWLEQVGIDVQQSRYDFTTLMSFLREGDYDLGLWGMAHTYEPDITSLLGTGGSNNNAGYSNEQMDALLIKGKQAVQATERYDIYHDVQELFKEDLPVIPLYSESVYSIQVDNLEGGVTPFYPATFENVHEWKFVD